MDTSKSALEWAPYNLKYSPKSPCPFRSPYSRNLDSMHNFLRVEGRNLGGLKHQLPSELPVLTLVALVLTVCRAGFLALTYSVPRPRFKYVSFVQKVVLAKFSEKRGESKLALDRV